MHLIILNGKEEGKRIDLAMGITTIGRSQKNTVVLPDDTYVSGFHAELMLHDNETLTLTDRGSRNGTYLFTEPVTTPVPLKPGDIFQVGRTLIKCTRRSQERFTGKDDERASEVIVVVNLIGSSDMEQTMGERMAMEIRDVLKQSIARALNANPAVYLKDHGNGFLLIFRDCVPAIQFSLNLLRDITTGVRKRGFHIRVGINCGETHKLPDNDRRGSAVDMAFRVESLGSQDMRQTAIGIRMEDLPGADRIFMTENMERELTDKSLFKIRCIGYFDLKGFNGRHKIFEVMG